MRHYHPEDVARLEKYSHVPLIVWNLDSLKIIEASHATAALVGLSSKKLIGRNIYELIPVEVFNWWRREYYPQLIDRGYTDPYDTTIIHLNGDVRAVRISAFVLRDTVTNEQYGHTVIVDMTEFAALKEEVELLRKAVLDCTLELLEHKKKREVMTPQEREIIRLIAENHTTEKIADKLGISVSTVYTHRRNIRKKLRLEGHAAIVERHILST
ncbi:MAG: PAS domain S-box protein [Desulfobacterales bacterium]|nr:PAS domain S-box protein [Desulfobacterales bacterium]